MTANDLSSWTAGGATVPTIAGTLLSLLAAPIGGFGFMIAVFGAWMPALVFSGSGILMWFAGRWLINR